MSARAAAGLALVAISVAAGVLPGVAPPLGTLLFAACGVVALIVVALRFVSMRRPGRSPGRPADQPAQSDEHEDAGVEAPELRIARVLFYAGCLLVAESTFRYAAGLTLGELVFTAAFALCALAALRGYAFTPVPTPLLVGTGIFAVGAVISSFDAQSPSGSAFQTLHAVYVLLLWPIVGAMVLRTRQQVIVAVTLWTLSGAIDGLGAIAQLFGVHLPGVAQEGNRMTGFTEHPNDLGSATAVALVPALLVATLSTGGGNALLRIMRWVPVALIAVGLALSGSVSAMLAAALAVIVWISSPVVRAPARVAVAAALVCALAVMAAGAGRVSSPVQRVAQIANPGAQNGGSVQDRLSIVQQTWPRITNDPFIGAGLDTSDSAVVIISHGYTTSYQVHGLPLAAWYETGILGLAGIIGLLGALATTGWRAVATSETDDDVRVGLALLAAFVAWVVVSMTQPMVFQQYGWISAVFIVAWRICTQPTVGGVPVTYPPGTSRARQEPAQSLLTAQ